MLQSHRVVLDQRAAGLPGVAASCLFGGFVAGLYVYWKLRRPPFVGRLFEFSIGIYSGPEPFRLSAPPEASNPVLTAADVTDVRASLVADPFLVREQGGWWMFLEVLNARTRRGEIGLAESGDGRSWTYRQIVLREPFHLSYPYVFEWRGEYYMIPESSRAFAIRLYKASRFPTEWIYLRDIRRGYYLDGSVLHHDDAWWLFAADRNDQLRLFYSRDLLGDWSEHPRSPIILADVCRARPAGRPTRYNGRIIRFAQEYPPTFQLKVRAFEIDLLTTTEYREREIEASPILQGAEAGWNGLGMHHVDPHEIEPGLWIAAVDGLARRFVLRP